MANKMTDDWQVLYNDAQSNAVDFLRVSLEQIDNLLGKGYAKAHPELLGAQIQAAAIQHHAIIVGKCILNLAESLEKLDSTTQNIADKLDEVVDIMIEINNGM